MGERQRERGKKAPALPLKTMHFISGSQHLPGHLTRSRLSPPSQAISVRNGHVGCVPHLWTVGCTSTAERTEVVVSIASCLFFPFSPPSLPPSLSCLTCGEQGDRSTIHVPVESPVQFCQSGSLSPWRGPQQTTVLPCCLSKSFFYSQPLPSSAPHAQDLLYMGCSISWGLFLLNNIIQAVS